MSDADPDRSLNRISTLWTVVCQAHDGAGGDAARAQEVLLRRYSRAVRRYLLGALRDPEAAEDLSQEFALRFLRGRFRGADQRRGRFRDFVKGVLAHLIADHHRRRRPPLPLDVHHHEPAAPAEDLADADEQFLASWREDILARAWEALEAHQVQTGQPLYTVLRFRADHPDVASARMAEQVGARLGKALTAAGVRQALHRAREKYVDLVLDEVVQTLEAPTAERVEEELIDLGLLEFCRAGLERLRRGS
jgi:RNA polymerase sigma-70 factor (ECF subfamily)